MDHADPEGNMKWYWTLYRIPAAAKSLEKGDHTIGTTGTGFKGQVGYEAPHSKGPGLKTYTITLYALAEAVALDDPKAVDRESLLAAMEGRILATSSLRVVYTSRGSESQQPGAAGPGRKPERRPQQRSEGAKEP
jgi:phosphatidylethanolamine-binding protein (PEBP) family uncharacterized protein